MKGLGVRVVSGVVLLALVLVAIWVKGVPLMLVIALATLLAAHEFYSIARAAGYMPWYPAGVALALLLALRGYIAGDSPLAGSVYKGPPMGVEVLVLALVMVLALVRLGVLWSRVPVTSGGRTTQQVAAR